MVQCSVVVCSIAHHGTVKCNVVLHGVQTTFVCHTISTSLTFDITLFFHSLAGVAVSPTPFDSSSAAAAGAEGAPHRPQQTNRLVPHGMATLV